MNPAPHLLVRGPARAEDHPVSMQPMTLDVVFR
jgi:hypothetical protein